MLKGTQPLDGLRWGAEESDVGVQFLRLGAVGPALLAEGSNGGRAPGTHGVLKPISHRADFLPRTEAPSAGLLL